ncbi:hypothetical protein HZU77_013480 [Neisseriaceae bacterium TC5R-5]|nr:hypothetical protein [Neisseriaceae bacterium TC5R-5]
MARKPAATQNVGIVVSDTEMPALPAMAEAANVMAAAHAGYSEERDLVNQLLGQAQMSNAFAQFSVTVTTSKLAFVKENKLYRALAGKSSGNGCQLSGSWDEFCGLLGISREKADLDIANLHAFGEEALESMSRMGIGYRELRQYRKLPEDQKAALIEVAKSGDKESFVELAEEIITKHAKEKAALTQRAEEAKADLEARARVLEDKNQHIDQITETLRKLEKHVTTMPPAEVGKQIRAEAVSLASQAEVGIRAVRAAFTALTEHTKQSGIPHDDVMAGLVGQMEVAVRQLRGEFAIKDSPDGQEVPAWLLGEEPLLSASQAADLAEA